MECWLRWGTLVAVALCAAARLVWIVPLFRRGRGRGRGSSAKTTTTPTHQDEPRPWARTPKKRRTGETVKTMVVLGSGGHTAEMLTLLRSMDCHARYTPRLYVIASTDGHSKTKMSQFEESLMQQQHKASSSSSASSSLGYATYLVPRSREVGQSYLSSVWTTAYAFVYSVAIVLRTMPDLILCNGPGTCVPICVAAYIPKFFGWKHITLVYVESLCRVKSLSLSGRLLAPLVDHFFVQWPQLLPRSPAGTLYLGRLC